MIRTKSKRGRSRQASKRPKTPSLPDSPTPEEVRILDELARLFRWRSRSANGNRTIDQLILRCLKPARTVRNALQKRLNARLQVAVGSIYGLLSVAQEEQRYVVDFSPVLLDTVAAEVNTTVERLTDELNKVFPSDWAKERFPRGPKEDALQIVSNITGVSPRALRDRVREVQDGEAFAAAFETMGALVKRGGEIETWTRENARLIFSQRLAEIAELEDRLKRQAVELGKLHEQEQDLIVEELCLGEHSFDSFVRRVDECKARMAAEKQLLLDQMKIVESVKNFPDQILDIYATVS